MALKFEKLADFGDNMGLPIGESAKELPQCDYRTEQYALPKFIGMRPTGIGKRETKIKRYLD